MAFKMVTDSEKSAGRVAGTALAFAEQIAGEQTAKWRDLLPQGQTVVDVEQLQRFHAQELLRLREDMRAKERAHLNQLDEIREARQRRDAAVPEVRRRLYAMRDLFQGVYGEKGPRALFLGKPTVPADATPLRRVGRLVVDKLLDRDLKLPKATLKGTELTRKTLAGEISDPLAELEAAMKELEEMLPLASQTLAEKREAHAAVDEKSAAFARFLEGLYGLEGHDLLAAKVRPSSHRSKKDSADAATSQQPDVQDAAPPPAAPPPAAPPPAAPPAAKTAESSPPAASPSRAAPVRLLPWATPQASPVAE